MQDYLLQEEKEFEKEFGEIEIEIENMYSYNGMGYKNITPDIKAWLRSHDKRVLAKAIAMFEKTLNEIAEDWEKSTGNKEKLKALLTSLQDK